LDYIFVSRALGNNISYVNHNWAFESSDHASLAIGFLLREAPKKGPGIARVNTNILGDPNTVAQIRRELITLINQIDGNWNPHMKLEFVKVAIRSTFSTQTSYIKKNINDEVKEVEDEVNQFEELRLQTIKLYPDVVTKTESVSAIDTAIHNLNIKLSFLRNKLSENLAFKSKAKWFEYGEKSNKFFLNLAKSRQKQKLISTIKDDDTEYNGQNEVSEGIRRFYEKLYRNKPRIFNPNDEYYKFCPKLTTTQASTLDEDLTLNNLYSALQTCKDSSPGPDGIPYIVYKKYWDLVGPIILESWKYSLTIGKLTPSHSESVITLLPKEGKDMNDIKNWRPITLSNCDSKIIAKALTI
jgi:hypothetical protein